MIKKLSFSYLLDTDKKLLFKIEKERNLLWSRGGFPALNKQVIMDNQSDYDWVGVKTPKRRFIINKKMLLDNFEDIKYPGFEPQIFASPFFWSESNIKAVDNSNLKV